MKEIGGYFELELASLQDYHPKAIQLNTARNSLELLLLHHNFSKIYVPYFTCDAVLEPIHKLNIEYQFYSIDENFEPIFDFDQKASTEAFLYTNYFGLKDDFIINFSERTQNLIIDNAQAFYSKPTRAVGTIYSPRKFFGLPDGGYLYLKKKTEGIIQNLEKDASINRFAHLLKRADLTAQSGYQDFVSNDESLAHQPIKQMSTLTSKLAKSIDYEKIKVQRQSNFKYLQEHLQPLNRLKFTIKNSQVPMVYPFWSDKKNLKQRLLQNLIFTATYWPNVLEWTDDTMLEHQFVKEILYLPIDQRYNHKDLDRIIEIIKENEG